MLSLGLAAHRLTEVLPAFLGAQNAPRFRSNRDCTPGSDGISPLFSTVLFFRPEYGFDLLVLPARPAPPPLSFVWLHGDGQRRATGRSRDNVSVKRASKKAFSCSGTWITRLAWR